MWKRHVVLILALFVLPSCAAFSIDSAIQKYQAVSPNINLGDTRETVVSILEPTQDFLPPRWRKSTEKYFKGDVLVEVYFARSGRQPDNLKTDDEFTPYVFNDGKLVAIGWTAIGGPKSQGQTIPITNVQAIGSDLQTKAKLRQMEYRQRWIEQQQRNLQGCLQNYRLGVVACQ